MVRQIHVILEIILLYIMDSKILEWQIKNLK